jgi:chemotaxis signal transduction protein
LLGIAGIRGELLPIFSLHQLLDYKDTEEIRWLLLCGEFKRVGLGIGEFFGCFRTPRAAFSAANRPVDDAQSQEIVVIESTVYTVISISSLTELLRNPMEGA